MELVLTALALLGFATGHSAHLALFAAHAVGAGWIAWRLLRTQPLTAMFIVAYLAMYFPNPIGILMGWIPPDSSDGVFFKSNALVLLGLDLFLVGARRLRLTRLGVNRLPRMRLSAFPVETTIMVLLALSALALFFLITTVQALGVNIFQVAKTYRSTGAASTYFLIASYCSMLLPLAVFLIGLKRLPAQVPYLAIVAVLLTLHFFIFRVRTIPVAVIMAYGVSMAARAYFVTLTSYTWRRRIPLWVRAALFIGVPLLPVVGVGIKYLRYSHELRDYRYDDARMSVTIEQTFSGGDSATRSSHDAPLRVSRRTIRSWAASHITASCSPPFPGPTGQTSLSTPSASSPRYWIRISTARVSQFLPASLGTSILTSVQSVSLVCSHSAPPSARKSTADLLTCCSWPRPATGCFTCAGVPSRTRS